MKKFNFREGRVYRQDRIIFEISKYEISDRKNELAHLHSRNLWPTVRVNDPFSLDLIAVRRSKLCPAFYPTERRGTRIYSLPHNLVIHRRDFYRRAVIDAPLVVIVLSFSPSWGNEGKEKRKKERKRRREKKRHRWKDGRERERENIWNTSERKVLKFLPWKRESHTEGWNSGHKRDSLFSNAPHCCAMHRDSRSGSKILAVEQFATFVLTVNHDES